jgi:hypothetical protein
MADFGNEEWRHDLSAITTWNRGPVSCGGAGAGDRRREYVETVIEKAISIPLAASSSPKTGEEIFAWLDSLAQFSDIISAMLGESFSRE